MEIQERDEKLMLLMAKYGAVFGKDIQEKIFKSKDYYRRRCLKLEKEGFIIRNNVLTYLSMKGVKYLEGKGVENVRYVVKSDMLHKKRFALICSMSFELTNFQIISSHMIKRLNVNDDKKYRYVLKIISVGGEEYYVYKVLKIKIGKNDNKQKKILAKKMDIELLKKDIKITAEGYKSENRKLMNAIIFYEDEASMGIYREGKQKLSLGQQILLPLSERGFKIANEIIAMDLHKNTRVKDIMRKMGYEIKEKSSPTQVGDFVVNNKTAFNLISNDYNTQSYLSNHLEITKSYDRVCIICTKEREAWFENVFKNVEIIAIELSK